MKTIKSFLNGLRSSHKETREDGRDYLAEQLEARVLYSGTVAPDASVDDQPVQEAPADKELEAVGADGSPVSAIEAAQQAAAEMEQFVSEGIEIAGGETDIPADQDVVILNPEVFGDLGANGGLGALSQEAAQGALDAAAERWSVSGVLTDDQGEALGKFSVQVADLEGDLLLVVSEDNSTILLDIDAAGREWFVDGTPLDDSEFGERVSLNGFRAESGAAVEGVDVLTILMESQGRLLGVDGVLAGRDVSATGLEEGLRRIPFADEALTNPDEVTTSLVIDLAQSAAQRWEDSGLSEGQLEALANIEYRVVDLSSGIIGAAEDGVISIDIDAAGKGWFVDLSPEEDGEFLTLGPDSGLFATHPDAQGRVDLLTAVLHEQGHVLGLSDISGGSANVMQETLGTGLRRLPADADALDAVPGSVQGEAYLTLGATQNPGFETGDLTGWTSYGEVSVGTSRPDSGTYHAIVGAGEGSSGINGTPPDGLPHDAFNGSAISTTITGSDGDPVRFRYNFYSTESPGDFSYNDTAFAVVSQTGVGPIHAETLASVTTDLSSSQETGYRTYEFVLPSSGEFTFSFGVVNSGDGIVSSFLLLDDGSFSQPAASAGPFSPPLTGNTPSESQLEEFLGLNPGAIDILVNSLDPDLDVPDPIGPTATTEVAVNGTTGDLEIADVDGANTNDDLTIVVDGTDYHIFDATNSIDERISIASVTGDIVIEGTGGDDTLTIDLSGGPITRPIIFNGGAGGNDDLVITGGTVATATYNFTNENDGSIELTGNALITYTGLEPITSTINATDVILNYGASSETITVSDAGGGNLTVDSNIGGETVTFARPTNSLTINAGGGNDIINVGAITGTMPSLTINGDGGNDTVNLNGDITFAAGKSLDVDLQNDSGTASGPNLISDGDFEVGIATAPNSYVDVGPFGAWTETASSAGMISVPYFTALPPRGGAEAMHVGDNYSSGAVSQTFATTIGKTYEVTLDVVGYAGTAGSVRATANGSLIGDYVDPDGSDWVTASHSFVATSNSTTLQIQNLTGASTIDDVVVQLVSVGTDTVNFGPGANVVLSGAGTATVKASGAVNLVAAGASLVTENGDITIEANQQATQTTGDFYGVSVNGAVIESTGSGAISIKGRGSYGGTSRVGVSINTATVRTDTGNITILGTGGINTGNQNNGVQVHVGGTVESTGGGSIDITGDAGSRGFGVRVLFSGKVLTSGTGSITLTGTGGAGAASVNDGVSIDLGTVGSGTAVANNGSGTITINGTAGTGGVGFFTGRGGTNRIGFDGTNAYSGDIFVNANTISIADSTIQSIGNLVITPLTASTTIGLGGGAGTLNLDDTELANIADGFSSITINGDLISTATEEFSGGTLSAGFDVSGPNVSFAGGNALFNGPGDGQRTYVRTVETANFSRDFVAEVTLTQGSWLGFFGMGEGTPTGGSNEPGSPTINLRLHPSGAGGATNTNDNGAQTLLANLSDGTHRLRLTWDATAQTATFEADEDYSGGAFTADYTSAPIDGSNNGFNDTNTRIFFGGAENNVFDNFTLTTGGRSDIDIDTATFTDPVTLIGGTISDNTGADISAGTNAVTLDGTIAPGQSPGIHTVTGNLSIADNSTYEAEIGGATPGTGAGFHDQIDVAGTVTIGNGVTLDTSAFGGYVPTGGEELVLINNDGTDAVTGTFDGLAEGATVSTNFLGSGLEATISYAGGTNNNDVVLTVLQSIYDFSTDTYTVTEGDVTNTVTSVTVNRTGSAVGASSVEVALAAGTTNGATAGVDFTGSFPGPDVTPDSVASTGTGSPGGSAISTLIDGITDHSVRVYSSQGSGVELTFGFSSPQDLGSIIVHNGYNHAGQELTQADLTFLDASDNPIRAAQTVTFPGVNGAAETATFTPVSGVSKVVLSNMGTFNWEIREVLFGTVVSGSIVNFADGESSKTVNIEILGDTTVELDETIALSLQNASGAGAIGTQGTATLTITNDDINTAPTITGTTAGQSVDDNATITPFSGVTLGDAESNALDITVTLSSAANGTLSGGGFAETGAGTGVYTLSAADPTAATTAIQALTFTPTENQVTPGSTVTTTFTIAVDDATAAPVTDNTTTVVATSINDAPVAVDDPAVPGDYATGEDSSLAIIAANGVLGNDSDVDVGASLSVIGVQGDPNSLVGSSDQGAAVTLGSNGAFTYDPTNATNLQALGAGEAVTDQFTYTIIGDPVTLVTQSVGVSTTAPTVDGDDISMLTRTDSDFGTGVIWGDRPARGQTFTTGSHPDGYVLSSVTLQSDRNQNANGSYTIRLGTLAGNNFTEIASETISTTVDVAANDYVTFNLGSPIRLEANTAYGFDVGRSGSGWVTGRNTDNTSYTGGSAYTTGSRGVGGNTISTHTHDRVFHLDLEEGTPTATAIVSVNVTGANDAPEISVIPTTISSTTGSHGGNYTGNLGKMIDGSGMSAPDLADPSTWTATSNSYPDEWTARSLLSGATNGKIAWTAFDLGSSVEGLNDLYVWNVRNVPGEGVKGYNLYYADSPTVSLPSAPNTNNLGSDYDFSSGGWTQLGGTADLSPKVGNNESANDVIDLGGITARYIGIEILSTQSATATRVGIAEVAVTRSTFLAETDNTLSATGTLIVEDVDTTDIVTASVDAVSVGGSGAASVPATLTNAILEGMLTVDTNLVVAGGATTGMIDWTFSSGGEAFDFLAKDETLELTYTLSATDDSGAVNNTDTETVKITITGTNDAPTGVADTGSAGENETKSFDVVGNDTDVDTGAVLSLKSIDSVSVSSANNDVDAITATSAFSIDGGQVKFTPGILFDALDFDDTATVTVNYTVEDEHGATGTASQTLTINGANDAPTGAADTTVSLVENALDGTAVRDVDVTDVDTGDTPAYAITSGNTDGAFAIDVNTGEITVNDNTKLDFDTMPQRVLGITVTDDQGATDTATITVNLTDAPANPTVNPADPATVWPLANDIQVTTVNGRVVITVGGEEVYDTDLSDISGEITINSGDSDDTLTIDAATVSSGITINFNGQGQDSTNPGDQIVVTGGSVDTITYNFTNQNDGSVVYDDGGTLTTINYTGLEPVTDNSDADNRILIFNGADETIEITDNGSTITVDSDFGEVLTFADPNVSLTIDAAGGNDTVTFINAFDAALDLDITSEAITQSAAITVSGTTTLESGAGNDITLNNAGNDFATVVVTSGNNVSLADSNGINLGASTVSGTLGVTASGVITDSGTLAVSGTTTLAAGAGNDITLNNAGNDFATVGITSGNNVSLTDSNGINLGASTVSGTLGVTASGAITDSGTLSVSGTTTLAAGAGNDITLDDGSNDFSTVGITSGNNVSLTDSNGIDLGASTVSGTLGVTASGAITDSGTLAVSGTTTLAAGAGNDITLDDGSNDFSTVGITSGNNVSLTDSNGIDLGASTVSGTLGVTASGVITDSGTLSVSGTTTLAAGAGNDITLDDGSNDFSTVGITSGNNVSLTDSNGIDLGASAVSGTLGVTASGAITDSGTLAVNGTTTLAAGAGNDITLDDGSSDFSTVGITSGNNVSLTDSNGIDLGASTVSGTFGVTASGAITDSGTLSVSGITTLAAGAGNDITLDDGSNDFTGAVSITTGNDVTLVDTNAIILGSSTVSGDLDVDAGTTITQNAAISVAGTTELDTAGGSITLTQNGNDFIGGVTATAGGTGDLSLTDANSISLGGLTASGNTVTVTALTGAITDGGTTEVTATNFVAIAATGVGTGADALETDVSNLEADGGTGGIYLDNTGALEIGNVDGTLSGLNSAGGDIVVTNLGQLTVSEEIDAGGGNVVLDVETGTAQSTIYAVNGNGAVDFLITIDPVTGAYTPVGSTGINFGNGMGLAYDANTETLYAVDGAGSPDSLYSIDSGTGAATFIGALPPTFNSTGLAFDPNTNTLYASSAGDLYTLDTTTGAPTSVGNQFVATQGLGFDPNTNTLYGIGNGSLYTLNTTTGGATLVGPLGVNPTRNGASFDASTNTLYMVDSTNDTLYTVDTGTGTATAVGAPFVDNLAVNSLAIVAGSSPGNLIVDADITTTGAGGIDLDAVGSITQSDGTSVTTGTGQVTLDAAEDITVANVSTGGNVNVTSTAGAILDAGDTDSDVTAANLVLTASTGIGTGANGALETGLGNLEADGGTGGIFVDNTGALIIGDIGATDGVSADGDISISSSGTLRVSEAVTSNGNDITLITDDITIEADIASSGGDLTIAPRTASTSIGVSSLDGDLNLDDTELSFLQDGFNSITIGDVANGTGLATVESVTFVDDVHIVGGSIVVTELVAEDTVDNGDGTGFRDATLSATNGTITTTNGGGFGGSGTATVSIEVTADDVTLNAAGDIGTSAEGEEIGLSANSITTTTDSASTMQYLSEVDTIVISGLDAGTGTATLVVNGEFDLSTDAIDDATSVVVEDGVTFDVNGASDTFDTITINAGGTLKGDGTLDANVIDKNEGEITPGDGTTGLINTGDLTLEAGSFYTVDLSGAASDTIVSNGNVAIAGNLDIVIGATAVTPGTVFTLIENISGTTTGQFNGLPEGSIISLAIPNPGTPPPAEIPERLLRISYVGGDGNDVTLTVSPEIATTNVWLDGTTLTLEDIAGNDTEDNLFVRVEGGALIITDLSGNNLGTLINGAVQTEFNEISFTPGTGVGQVNFTDIVINTGNEADSVTVGDLGSGATGLPGSLTIVGGDGQDRFIYNGAGSVLTDGSDFDVTAEIVTFASGSSLTVGTSSANTGGITVDAGNDGTAGAGVGTFTGIELEAASLAVTGDGDVDMVGEGGDTQSRNHGIALDESSILTENGGISLEGIVQATNITQSSGVLLNDSTVGQTGVNATGVIAIDGTSGGTGVGSYNVGVTIEYGSEVIALGDGSIDIDGEGADGGSRSYYNYGVKIARESALSSVDGTVSIDGEAGAGHSYNSGISLIYDSSIRVSGSGDIVLSGAGGDGVHRNYGVGLERGVDLETGTGSILLTGTGGSGTGGNESAGVRITDSVVRQTEANATGVIAIDGTGVSGGARNAGVLIDFGSAITALGSTAIDIDGIGADGNTFGYGVNIVGASALSSVDGDVTLDGTGGDGTGSTASNNMGVSLESDASVTVSGSGDIALTGTGGDGARGYNAGVALHKNGASLETGSGSITLVGIAGGGLNSNYNNGVKITGSSLKQTAAGLTGATITIDGTGSGTGMRNTGVEIDVSSVITALGETIIDIDGVGADGRGYSQGVRIGRLTSLSSVNGNVTIDGEGGDGGRANQGVTVESGSGVTVSGTGGIMVNGTGGDGTGYNTGVTVSSGTGKGFVTNSGAISVTGTSGTGSSSKGLIVGSRSVVQSLAGGSISLSGTSRGSGSQNSGLELSYVTVDTTGDVILFGAGSSTASGYYNRGIYLLYSTIRGNSLNITGNGGTGSNYNEGVRVMGGSLSGDLNLTGTANSATTGRYNTGVYLLRVDLSGAGAGPGIFGTGGGGTGYNHGIHVIGSIYGGSYSGTAGEGNLSEAFKGAFLPPAP